MDKTNLLRRKILILTLGIIIFICHNILVAQWQNYSAAQYDSLRRRWTPQDIQSVVAFINQNAKFKSNSFFTCVPPGDTIGYDFRGVVIEESLRPVGDLRYAHFEGAKLSHLDCRGKNLKGIYFTDARLDTAVFEKANLEEAHFADCTLLVSNFKGANLKHAYFKFADLRYANLDSAQCLSTGIDFAQLDSALCRNTDFSGATLCYSWGTKANFQGSKFVKTQMKGTELWNADLRNCDFSGANLRGACISDANVGNAGFFGALFDSTKLEFVNLSDAKIRYVIWGDTLHKRYAIGEEYKLAEEKSKQLSTQATRESITLHEEILIDTYRDLENIYRREGKTVIADAFHFRMNEVITNSYSPWNPLKILRFIFLRLSYGYGTEPSDLAFWSLGIVLIFMFVFASITSTQSESGIYIVKTLKSGVKKEYILQNRGYLLFVDCFYFSLLSFSTFGYGAMQPKQWLEFFHFRSVEFRPVGWARICVGIEATLGIYTFALLVTTAFGSN